MMMRILLVLGAMVMATAAFAQSAPAPATTGDKPPAQEKPKVEASKSKDSQPADSQSKDSQTSQSRNSQPKSIAERLQACLKLDDGTKYRLDCFDAVLAPQPKPNPPLQKKVMDCRFLKEQDERLACFNGFTEQIPKFNR